MLARIFLLMPFAAATALIIAGCGGQTSATTPRRPLTPYGWHVIVGASTSQEAIQGLDYYPAALTVDAGDTVTWSFPTAEVHTVTLLGAGQATPPPPNDPSAPAPAGSSTYDGSAFTSSGFLAGGATYALTFTKPGTYKVYCLTHQPEQTATITVQQAGAAYPQTQAAYDAQAQSAENADLAAGTASVTSFPYTAGGPHIAAGLAPGHSSGPPATSTVLRFLDTSSLSTGPVDVAVGTTVTWTNQSNNEPHDVVFPPAGQTPPPTLSPFSPPSGGATYDGTTLVDSGVIMPGQNFALTFTRAGTYKYYCLFHDDDGMIATIVVH